MSNVNGYYTNYRYVAKHVEDRQHYYSTTVEPILTDLIRTIAVHRPSNTKDFLAGAEESNETFDIPQIPEDAEPILRKILKALLLEQPKDVLQFVKSYCKGTYVPSRAASTRSLETDWATVSARTTDTTQSESVAETKEPAAAAASSDAKAEAVPSDAKAEAGEETVQALSPRGNGGSIRLAVKVRTMRFPLL